MNMLTFLRSSCWTITEGKMEKLTRKAKCTDCEIEVLVTEVEHHKCVPFSVLSGGISNKRKKNYSSNTSRKQWTGLAPHCELLPKWVGYWSGGTGGGRGEPRPSQLHHRIVRIIGLTLWVRHGVQSARAQRHLQCAEPNVGVQSARPQRRLQWKTWPHPHWCCAAVTEGHDDMMTWLKYKNEEVHNIKSVKYLPY